MRISYNFFWLLICKQIFYIFVVLVIETVKKTVIVVDLNDKVYGIAKNCSGVKHK